MGLICPVSERRLNEAAARLVAFFVLLAMAGGYFAYLPWVAVVLAMDFLVRGFTSSPASPLALLARSIVNGMHLPFIPINAGPKIFAARIGFVFCLAIALLGFLEFRAAAVSVAAVLAACAGLEACLGLCVGCHVYTVLLKMTKRGTP